MEDLRRQLEMLSNELQKQEAGYKKVLESIYEYNLILKKKIDFLYGIIEDLESIPWKETKKKT